MTTVTSFQEGPLSKRPAASGNTGLIYTDETGRKWQSDGAAWAEADSAVLATGGSSAADATTSVPGVVEVDHAPSGAHPVALTTDGTELPAAMLGTGAAQALPGDALPDVTGDRQTPGGLVVAGNVEAASYSGGAMCRLGSGNTSGTVASGARFRVGWLPPLQVGSSFSAVADGGLGYPAIEVADAGTYAVVWEMQMQLVAAGRVMMGTFDQTPNQTVVERADYWPQTTTLTVQLSGSEIWVVSSPPGDFTLELHNDTADDITLLGPGGAQMHIYKISGDTLPF